MGLATQVENLPIRRMIEKRERHSVKLAAATATLRDASRQAHGSHATVLLWNEEGTLPIAFLRKHDILRAYGKKKAESSLASDIATPTDGKFVVISGDTTLQRIADLVFRTRTEYLLVIEDRTFAVISRESLASRTRSIGRYLE